MVWVAATASKTQIGMAWPVVPGSDGRPGDFPRIQFQWSHDGNYIARMAKDKAGGDVIQIYELPTMNLLDKKSLRAIGVRDFLWSPKDLTLTQPQPYRYP